MLPGQKIGKYAWSSAGILVGSKSAEKDQCDLSFISSGKEWEAKQHIKKLTKDHIKRYDHLGVLMTPYCDYAACECVKYLTAKEILTAKSCFGESAAEQTACLSWTFLMLNLFREGQFRLPYFIKGP
jgi:hypothetical protein